MFFGGLSLKIILVLGKAMFKVLLPHFPWFFVHFDKLIRPHLGPLWGGGFWVKLWILVNFFGFLGIFWGFLRLLYFGNMVNCISPKLLAVFLHVFRGEGCEERSQLDF